MSYVSVRDHDRYSRIAAWARARYRNADGSLVIDVGGIASRYSMIEDLAAARYLGVRRYRDAQGRKIVYRSTEPSA